MTGISRKDRNHELINAAGTRCHCSRHDAAPPRARRRRKAFPYGRAGKRPTRISCRGLNMFWRAFIREGDAVTPGGGLVQPRPQSPQVRYSGKTACFEGDPVYCNSCKSWGVTQCLPPYRPHRGPDGRQASLDGDLCICKCPTPPRLKALHSDVRMAFEGELAHGLIPANNSVPTSAALYDQRFLVQNERSRRPLANVTYRITLADGKTYTGLTDANGFTETVSSNTAQKVKIEVPFYDDSAIDSNPCIGSDACRC